MTLSKVRHTLREREKNATTAWIAMWYTSASVFTKGAAVLSTSIFSRLLTKPEFGYFNNFTSWENILMILVTLDFVASIARAKYDFEDRMDEYLSTILFAGNIITLALYIAVELNGAFFVKLFDMDILYIRVLFVYMLFEPAFTFLQTKYMVYRRYQFFVAFSVGFSFVRAAVSVLMVVLAQDKLTARILGFCLPVTVINIAMWIYIAVKGKKISFSALKYACKISVPLIPHALSGIILGNSDRIMIMKICGGEANALYSLAYQVSLLANIIWTAMNQAWTPWLYDNIHAGNLENIRKRSKLYLGAFAVIITGVFLVTPEGVLILGGKEYYESRFVMPPVILGCAFQFVYGMYVNLETYAKKTTVVSVGTVLAAALNIALNWVFIPKYGYIAAAFTTLAGYVALFFFHFFIVMKVTPEFRRIYSRGFIFAVLGVLTGVAAGAYWLYDHPTARYIAVGVYAVAMLAGCIKYRAVLLRLLGMKFKIGKREKQENNQ